MGRGGEAMVTRSHQGPGGRAHPCNPMEGGPGWGGGAHCILGMGRGLGDGPGTPTYSPGRCWSLMTHWMCRRLGAYLCPAPRPCMTAQRDMLTMASPTTTKTSTPARSRAPSEK